MPGSARVKSCMKSEHATITRVAEIQKDVIAKKQRQLRRLQSFGLQQSAEMRVEEVAIKRGQECPIGKLVDLGLPERHDNRHRRQPPRRVESRMPVLLHHVVKFRALYCIAKLAKTGAVRRLHEIRRT